jgi:hypothetical protein
MDAITEETPLAPEAPQHSHHRRRRASPLVSALRSIAPDERHAAISAVLREIEEEERRQELLARSTSLPTEELARLLQVGA